MKCLLLALCALVLTLSTDVAVITGLFLATYSIGSALGNCVSGAYWTNTLPAALARNLEFTNNGTALAASAYSNPFVFIASYPMGTPERDAVVSAYRDTQRVLCIIGICLTLPLIAFGLCTRNRKLGKEQSLKNAEIYDKDNASSSDEEASVAPVETSPEIKTA